MKKGNMAVVIMGLFAKAVPAPPLQMSPLAEVLAKHKGGKGNSVHRKYRKPNKWDVLRTCGTQAWCRNRTTGEVAMKQVKLGPCAQLDHDRRLQFNEQQILGTSYV
jgi:hypothetical protein